MFCAKSRPAGPATTDFGDILAAARRIVRTIVVTSEAPAAPCFSAGVGVGAGTSGTIACGGSEAPVVPGLQVADSPVALAVAGTREADVVVPPSKSPPMNPATALTVNQVTESKATKMATAIRRRAV